MNRHLRFSVTLTLVFLAGAAFVAVHHELWRDEMQAWLISRDSPGLEALLLQGRYDGTPPLWFLLLRPLTVITHRPEAMQVLTWGLAGLTFFLLCHFAPFSRLQKILLLFNYYFLFEYGTVCRQYLPGILLLCGACILLPSARQRPWLFTLVLLGAALTSVYSLILVIGLAAAFWGTAAGNLLPARDPRKLTERCHLPSLIVLLGGVSLAVCSMLPEADTFYGPAATWHFDWDADRLLRVACLFSNAHFLLPRPDGFFWIPAWLTDFSAGQYLGIALSLPLLVGIIWLLRPSIEATVFYVVSALGVLLFTYTKYLGFPRHAGFLFVALLLALWLKARPSAGLPSAGQLRPGWAGIALTLLLAVQAVTGAWAGYLDFGRDFSRGKAAARELAGRHLENATIAVWPDSAGAVVAGYLDRQIYYPQSDRRGSFARWDVRSSRTITDTEALRLAERARGTSALVIVLTHELAPELMQAHGLTVIGFFQGSLASFEDYFVYGRPADGRGSVSSSARLTEAQSHAGIRPSLQAL